MTNQNETPNKAQSFFKSLGSLILGWFSAFPLIGLLLVFDGLGQQSVVREGFILVVIGLAAIFAVLFFIVYDKHDRVKDGIGYILAFVNIIGILAVFFKVGTADQRVALLASILALNAILFIFGYCSIVKFKVVTKEVRVEIEVPVEVEPEPLPEVVVPVVENPDATQPLSESE